MEYKTIQELYLAVGVAGAIIIVFLGLFTYLVIANDKKRTKQIDDLIKSISTLQMNDTDFKTLIESLIESVKELSLIHISEPTRREWLSRMPSSA